MPAEAGTNYNQLQRNLLFSPRFAKLSTRLRSRRQIRLAAREDDSRSTIISYWESSARIVVSYWFLDRFTVWLGLSGWFDNRVHTTTEARLTHTSHY